MRTGFRLTCVIFLYLPAGLDSHRYAPVIDNSYVESAGTNANKRIMIKKLNRKTAAKAQTYPVKVLQFGKGNFLRAFADWMIDVLNEKERFQGAVQIVQVNAQATDENFNDQDGLYHVALKGMRAGAPVEETRLITCVDSVLNPFSDYDGYLRAAENPELRFVISNTTEAGIEFNEADSDPARLPVTFPGKLAAFLHRRYTFFKGDPSKALTILPCELIENNGEALCKSILQYADHWSFEKGFATWVTEHTLFCNTLVDRIVPGFPKDNAEAIWSTIGFEDRLLVIAEPFHLWVIQPMLRPGMSLDGLRSQLPLEQAGLNVKFTNDLAAYRMSKVRILNGSHTAMVPIGYLRGLRTVKEVIDDSVMGTFVRNAIAEEIIPTLDLPTDELQKFSDDTVERFQNPFIRHELKAIALNAVSKFQVRVLPTILEYKRRKGQLPQKLVQSLAALILFYKGEWKGKATPVNDTPPVLEFFSSAWSKGTVEEVVDSVLANHELWKMDLTTVEGLREAVKGYSREMMKGT